MYSTKVSIYGVTSGTGDVAVIDLDCLSTPLFKCRLLLSPGAVFLIDEVL